MLVRLDGGGGGRAEAAGWRALDRPPLDEADGALLGRGGRPAAGMDVRMDGSALALDEAEWPPEPAPGDTAFSLTLFLSLRSASFARAASFSASVILLRWSLFRWLSLSRTSFARFGSKFARHFLLLSVAALRFSSAVLARRALPSAAD